MLIELFGYRDSHSDYHPLVSHLEFTHSLVANKEIIHDIFDPVVNRDGAAYIGDPNRHLFSKQSMVRYLNNGLCLLDQLIAERHYSRDTVSRITALEEKEPLAPSNTLIKKDSSYERRLAKVRVGASDDQNTVGAVDTSDTKETLRAGELIGYYYKPVCVREENER